MNIILGVTGGIAAYKAAHLVRLFVGSGHSVRVVMTRAAKDFITPLTMATVSGNPVVVENFDPENGAWNSHISLATWADVIVVAPATANTLAKMAAGIADNLLLCTVLSARGRIVVAPAMDLDMWAAAATVANMATLINRGVEVVEPGEGFLASGLVGKGRMAEPETIAQAVTQIAPRAGEHSADFVGRRVMITAGATIEKIDPVRYISNFSTGKMGQALYAEFSARGADVVLIKGQMSAQQMYEAAAAEFDKCDVAIFAAAVADYTVDDVPEHKIKHSEADLTLRLVPTRDIAATLSATKRRGQFTVGFALETDHEQQHAMAKLKSKHLDAIVLNSLSDSGAGFATDTNKITIIDTLGRQAFELKSKRQVAGDIADYVFLHLKNQGALGD
ncbi:MAG: bifunctional phosphopantothenoylcysteine decarboxylase/phosphopantothenate--cysteine ligase CoaBC [Mucinivorans sp.]